MVHDSEHYTREYIEKHISRIRKHLGIFIHLLNQRAIKHDESKLKSPEFEMWCEMDKEPRYKYGTEEYNAKMKKWQHLFDLHYRQNRHHPEHFNFGINGMTLVDLIEMLCDWLGYKDVLSITEAIETVERQMRRFGFTEELRNIMVNTLIEYFSVLGGKEVGGTPSGIERELGSKKEKVSKKPMHIDITV